MTVKEARKIIAVIMVTYPNYKPVDVELAAKIWSDTTDEYDYESVDSALKYYIRSDTSGFAPSPGQIISICEKQAKQNYITFLEKQLLDNSYNSYIEEIKATPLEGWSDKEKAGLTIREWDRNKRREEWEADEQKSKM